MSRGEVQHFGFIESVDILIGFLSRLLKSSFEVDQQVLWVIFSRAHKSTQVVACRRQRPPSTTAQQRGSLIFSFRAVTSHLSALPFTKSFESSLNYLVNKALGCCTSAVIIGPSSTCCGRRPPGFIVGLSFLWPLENMTQRPEMRKAEMYLDSYSPDPHVFGGSAMWTESQTTWVFHPKAAVGFSGHLLAFAHGLMRTHVAIGQ